MDLNLTIVIPLYNSEKYIAECLESAIYQDIEKGEYEILVVNDGSTDNGPAIVEEYIRKYHFIRMVNQVNKGLSEARNTGINNSQGRYIMLLDSDDWLCKNCLGTVLKKCLQYDLDILRFCGANVMDREVIRRFNCESSEVKKGKSYLNIDIQVAAPFSVYKRNYLNDNGLRFFPGIYHEDIDFTPRAYYYAERVLAINDICYLVRQTPGSITRSVNVKKALDLMLIIKRANEFYMTVSDDTKQFFHDRIGASLNLALHQALLMNKEEQKQVQKAIYSVKSTFFHLRKSSLKRYRMEWILFSFFPRNTVKVFGLLMKYARK